VTKQLQLSVVIMAFNEAETLRTVVLDALAELENIEGPHELLIVDDGSTDATGAVAAALAVERPEVRVLRHPYNRGLGGVYRTGFEHSRGRLLTFLPADGQFPAHNIGRLHHAVHQGDMALGYIAERPDSLISRLLSGFERVLYRTLFGDFPRFQGLLMFRRAMLQEIPLTSVGRGWGVLMELVLKASRGRYRLASVRTEVKPRQAGRSKVRNIRTVVANLRQLVALRRTLRRRFGAE
jgi:dolichol-phosphate mannosyltransferase